MIQLLLNTNIFKKFLKILDKTADEVLISFKPELLELRSFNNALGIYFGLFFKKELFKSFEIKEDQILINSKKFCRQLERISGELKINFNNKLNLLQIFVKEPDTKINIPIYSEEEFIPHLKIPVDTDDISFNEINLEELKIGIERLRIIGSDYFFIRVYKSKIILSARGHIDREETITKININVLKPFEFQGKFRLNPFSELLETNPSKIILKFKKDYPLYIDFKFNNNSKNTNIFGYLLLSDYIEEDDILSESQINEKFE